MNCPICEASESWPIAGTLDPDVAGWRAEAGVTRPYFWQLCKTCGNGYPTEPPLATVLDRYWQTDRRVEGGAEAEEDAWQRRIGFSRVGAERSFKVFAPLHHSAPGRFLDIACGLGETVRKFRDNGWQAEGIDLDATTKRFHDRLGLQTRIGRFETESFNGRYHIIHIAHAIYFITEPMAFLYRVRGQLESAGILGIVISDFLAAHAQSEPTYACTFYPCAESMRYALSLAGLNPFVTRTIGGSIYIAARPGEVTPTKLDAQRIYWRYRTKKLRFATIGRPYLAARSLAKRALSLVR